MPHRPRAKSFYRNFPIAALLLMPGGLLSSDATHRWCRGSRDDSALFLPNSRAFRHGRFAGIFDMGAADCRPLMIIEQACAIAAWLFGEVGRLLRCRRLIFSLFRRWRQKASRFRTLRLLDADAAAGLRARLPG